MAKWSHLTEPDQQVLWHLPENVHVHNAATISVAQDALALVAA